MKLTLTITCLSLAALGSLGCLPDGPGEKGELGNDRFFYECALPADAACDDPSTSGIGVELEDIPTVALGSTFALTTEELDTDPVSPTDRLREVQIATGAVAFEAVEAGQAVIISSSSAGQGLDLTHIVVEAPVAAAFFQRDPSNEWQRVDGSLSAEVGDSIELRAAPIDDLDNVLAGALPVTWAAEPAGIVSLPTSQDNNVLSVDADAAGQVTITVTVGDLSTTIDLDVTEVAQ